MGPPKDVPCATRVSVNAWDRVRVLGAVRASAKDSAIPWALAAAAHIEGPRSPLAAAAHIEGPRSPSVSAGHLHTHTLSLPLPGPAPPGLSIYEAIQAGKLKKYNKIDFVYTHIMPNIISNFVYTDNIPDVIPDFVFTDVIPDIIPNILPDIVPDIGPDV
jgi:hypothetical protein